MCDLDTICPLIITCLSSASIILNTLALKAMKQVGSRKTTCSNKKTKVDLTPDGVVSEV